MGTRLPLLWAGMYDGLDLAVLSKASSSRSLGQVLKGVDACKRSFQWASKDLEN